MERDGTPVAGVLVKYSLFDGPVKENRSPGCSDPLATTVSSDDGHFQMSEAKRWGLMLPFPANYFGTLRLCLENPRGEVTTWDYSWSGPPSTPSYMKLQCDVATRDVCRLVETNDELWYPTRPN